MLNGNVLKIAFLMIVFTLCGLLWIITIGAAFFNLPLENFQRILAILGTIGIFSGIVQAYIHANIADKASSDTKAAAEAPKAIVAQNTPTVVGPIK